MIQFNLLPVIKMEYIKAQRNKRFVIAIASVVSSVSLVILIGLSLAVFVFQKQHIDDLSTDINGYAKNLEATGDIGKILTVQNQLNSLSDLHDKKQASTRIFPYLQQLVPLNVSLANLELDYDAGTIMITGGTSAPATGLQLAAVNSFVDTLKFTNYTTQGSEKKLAFSEVVLTSFGLTGDQATYTISAKFDPAIFSLTDTVTLVVPSQISTRSETEKPTPTFAAPKPASKE